MATESAKHCEFERHADELVHYLSTSTYPPSVTSETQKRIIRRRSKSFSYKEGTLYYVGSVGNCVRRQKHAYDTWRAEVVTSPEHQRQKMYSMHVEIESGAHLGRDKTIDKASRRFYWPGMVHDVKNFVKTCDQCRRGSVKPRRQKKHTADIHPMPASSVWVQVGVDIIGPMNETKDGNKYIITLSDHFSKWPEAKAVQDISTQTVAVFLHEIISRLGCFKVIITDQGREFVNKINEELFKLTGAEHRIGYAFHPHSSGLDERFNETLHALIKVCSDEQNDWDQYINAILFRYRTAVHSSTKLSPFVLMYGREPVLPVDIRHLEHQAMETNISDFVDQINILRQSATTLAIIETAETAKPEEEP